MIFLSLELHVVFVWEACLWLISIFIKIVFINQALNLEIRIIYWIHYQFESFTVVNHLETLYAYLIFIFKVFFDDFKETSRIFCEVLLKRHFCWIYWTQLNLVNFIISIFLFRFLSDRYCENFHQSWIFIY